MSNQSSFGAGLPSLSKIFDKSNEKSIRLIADAMPQIVWIAGADGTIEYFNRAWIDFTGHTLEQSLGAGWQSVLHPDDVHKCHGLWLDAIKASAPLEAECRFRRAADGTYRYHLARAHALKDETDTIVKWVGSCADIDDQKVAQQSLRESVVDVERQVRERTTELLTTNMQLLDAISERRQAAVFHEQDTQRLNGIIATQALLAHAGLSLPSFLDLASQKIQRLTGATGTVVELIEQDELVYAAATGGSAPFKGLRLKMSNSLSGLCIRKRQVLKCDNSNDDPRVDKEACLKVGAVTLVVAPLYNQGAAIGVLKIVSDSPNAFGQRDVQTLELMAGLLGAAIAQQVHMQSSNRLLAERTEALSALQKEVESRLHSEQQLRETEYRTRRILESAHDAFFSVNRESILVEWNGQAETMFGWLRHEVLGRQFAELLLPADARAALCAEVDQIVRSGETSTIGNRIELIALHRNGNAIPIEVSIFLTHDSDAQAVNFFVRNISAYKRLETRLARNEKDFHAIADDLPAWIAYIDAQERYCFANAYYVAGSGISPSDLIGRTVSEVVGEDRYAGMKDEIGKAMRGMEVRYERRVDKPEGVIRQKVHYIPDTDENGAVIGFYSIVTKVDEGTIKKNAACS